MKQKGKRKTRALHVCHDGITFASEPGIGLCKLREVIAALPTRRPARPSTQCFFTAAARPSTRYFYSCARPPTHYFPPVLQHVALFLATFWPLLPSWSRVRPNDLYHRFRLGQTELLSPTCIIATGSL